jgi:hypothetical protein
MPSTVRTISLTAPTVDSTVIVTATYDAEKSSGSNFDAGASLYIVVNQGGTVTTGPSQAISLARAKYTSRLMVPIVAGVAFTVSLMVYAGTITVTLNNVELEAEVIKR